METRIRTITKTFSYRTVVAVSIFLAALGMNYSSGFGLTFVVMSFTVGFASFFMHERAWNLSAWGKQGTHDTKKRSVVKTITWRIWAFVILFAIGMLLGLPSTDAVEWSIVTNVLFLVVHYLHERAWNRISWGINNKETV